MVFTEDFYRIVYLHQDLTRTKLTNDKGIYKGFYRIVYLHQEFSSSISRTFVGVVSSFLDVQFLGLRDRPWKRRDSHVQYPVTF